MGVGSLAASQSLDTCWPQQIEFAGGGHALSSQNTPRLSEAKGIHG